MEEDYAADPDTEIHLYAKGDKAKCWTEDGGRKLICDVENGCIKGYEGSRKRLDFPADNKSGRCWMTKDDQDCVWMAWG